MSPTARRRSRCSRRSARKPPQFAHEALLVAAEGKLSKRLGSYGAEHLREEGVEPMALLSVLARIGTSQPVEPIAEPRRARRRLRLCAFRPRAGAFRSARGRTDQCAAAAQARLCRCRRSAAGRRDRGGLAAAAAEPRASRRFRRLVRGAARRDRAAGARATTSGCWSEGRCGVAREARLVGRAVAGADRRSSSSRPARRAASCFIRCAWRSPGARADPEMAGLVARMGKDRAVRRLEAAAKR